MLNHHFQQNEMKDISESASLKSARKPVAELTNSQESGPIFLLLCNTVYFYNYTIPCRTYRDTLPRLVSQYELANKLGVKRILLLKEFQSENIVYRVF